jgi:Tfp pilus assembly protein PilX
MIYLVLFSSLAVGFYASTTIQVQISGNEQRKTRALAAPESGLAYLRCHLAIIDLPPLTTDDQTISELYNKLVARMNGTPNMTGKTVGVNAARTQIDLPAGDGGAVAMERGREK